MSSNYRIVQAMSCPDTLRAYYAGEPSVSSQRVYGLALIESLSDDDWTGDDWEQQGFFPLVMIDNTYVDIEGFQDVCSQNYLGIADLRDVDDAGGANVYWENELKHYRGLDQ